MNNTGIALRLSAALAMAVNAASAQPLRLYSYAKYELLSASNKRLVDTGRFMYSGTRGLVSDTANDFPSLFPRPDYSQLNAWYSHQHLLIAPRADAQFDSFHQWLWVDSTSSLQPFRTAVQMHSAQTLDSLVELRPAGAASSYRWLYNASGQPVIWRESEYDAAASAWVRTAGGQVIRNSAGQPSVKETGQYDNGILTGIATSNYQYNLGGWLQTITTGLGVGLREQLIYDAVGRIHTWTGEEYDSVQSNWTPILRDSFRYAGGTSSSQCSHIYSIVRNAVGGPLAVANVHAYTYTSDGRLASYSVSGTNRIFQYDASNRMKKQIQTASTGSVFETYFYYDSLGAADVAQIHAPVSVEVFPNPASDRIFIRASRSIVAYKLCSLTGQEIKRGTVSGRQTDFSISAVPVGVYILSVQAQDGGWNSMKITRK